WEHSLQRELVMHSLPGQKKGSAFSRNPSLLSLITTTSFASAAALVSTPAAAFSSCAPWSTAHARFRTATARTGLLPGSPVHLLTRATTALGIVAPGLAALHFTASGPHIRAFLAVGTTIQTPLVILALAAFGLATVLFSRALGPFTCTIRPL